MAAYLVGTRGTPLHAAGLGLSVTLSHTLGILVLAAVVVGAQGSCRRTSSSRRRRSSPRSRSWRSAAGCCSARAGAAGASGRAARGHEHAHDHGARARPRRTRQTTSTRRTQRPSASTATAASTHTHLPPAGTTISWRSLFVLGLAGGLIPSTSALLILLGSIAAGRPAFGFVLVVAFGLGMALVMGGIGLALVLARGRLDRVDAGLAARPGQRRRPARGGGPRLRARPLPDHPGGRRPGHVLTRVGPLGRPRLAHPHRTAPTRANAQHVIRSSLC